MSSRISALACCLAALVGCSAEPEKERPGGSGGGAAGTGGIGGSISAGSGAGTTGGGPCVNLQCRQRQCSSGSTTVSGKVYDPAGNNPLYNVVVYVPNAPLQALPVGVSCDACNDLYSGQPIATALTDAAGSFVLQNVPEGVDVPIVLQIGKWRRQLVLPSVTACQDNPQPDGTLRLPKNRGEGDIPKIAVSTGMADTLECLLRRIGVDASEYVPGGGDGSIHIFRGSSMLMGANPFPIPGFMLPAPPNTSPPGPDSPAALWSAVENLLQYDIVLLSCEGGETQAMNQQALHDYASAGGRVFASHFHYAWFSSGPYASENLAAWSPGGGNLGDIQGTIVTTLSSGQPFPKGMALEQWLTNVGALQNGLLPIREARHNAHVDASHTPSQSWILADASAEVPGATQYFSFNTPTDAILTPDAPYCGRVVFSDLHVGAASNDDGLAAVPNGCSADRLSPQEAALEFMLFDLSSCVVPDDAPPTAPPVE